MERTEHLYQLLADGHFHSGETLSEQLGVSRSSIWNHIKALRNLGLDVYSVPGQGYRLAHSVEPLELNTIRNHMDAPMQSRVSQWNLHWNVDSTNAFLLEQARQGAQSGAVCMSEMQSSGRGRRGRQWCSPLGSNLYLSLLWRFVQGTMGLSGLNIASAVAVARAIKRLASAHEINAPIALKWPNDIFMNGSKLAGILMEVSGEASGPCAVVLGVGLNVHMDEKVASGIDQPWTDLHSVIPEVSRNQLAGLMLSELLSMFASFETHGLAPFLEDWNQMDAFAGKEAELLLGDQKIAAQIKGITDNGALLAIVDGQERVFHSGEIRISRDNSDNISGIACDNGREEGGVSE